MLTQRPSRVSRADPLVLGFRNVEAKLTDSSALWYRFLGTVRLLSKRLQGRLYNFPLTRRPDSQSTSLHFIFVYSLSERGTDIILIIFFVVSIHD